jgi:circadian clock protein KaiB
MKAAQAAPRNGALRLQLYVAGESPNSIAAIRHLRALLSGYPGVKVELELVDVLKHPERAMREGVLVTPTMVKLSPAPRRRVVGNLKDPEVLVSVLGLSDAHRE